MLWEAECIPLNNAHQILSPIFRNTSGFPQTCMSSITGVGQSRPIGHHGTKMLTSYRLCSIPPFIACCTATVGTAECFSLVGDRIGLYDY